jgi:hypothetical protein
MIVAISVDVCRVCCAIQEDALIVWKYYRDIWHACEMFGVDFPVAPLKEELGQLDAIRLFYDTKSFVD